MTAINWLNNPSLVAYQGIPPQNMPFLNSDGTVNIMWYKFLNSLWIRTGLDTPGMAITGHKRYGIGSPITLQPGGLSCQLTYVADPVAFGYYLQLYDQVTGMPIGTITLTTHT